MALPKEGYFEHRQGKYGPVYPKTPACYGFTIIAKIKPGREEVIRGYGNTIEAAIRDFPDMLRPLKLHYLRLGACSTSARIRTSCTRASSTPNSTSTRT